MNAALRSSILEIVMLVLCIAWAVIFSASLLNPSNGSMADRGANSVVSLA
jgi:hypothetical protein